MNNSNNFQFSSINTTDNLLVEKKLNWLYELEEHKAICEEDWHQIISLAFDSDAEVRLQVSEILALFPSKESENLLLGMLNDTSFLVRASVCDSLHFSNSPIVLHALVNSTNDKHYLVRGYAALSIGDIQYSAKANSQQIIEYLKNMERTEKNEWVKIAVYRSLFLLNEVSYGTKLLNMVNSRFYKNRCFVINLLSEFIDLSYEIPEMENILRQRLKSEKYVSVKESIKKILIKIENKWK